MKDTFFGTTNRTFVTFLIPILIGAYFVSTYQEHPRYPIKNSGLIFQNGIIATVAPIYWLDNDHVLFPGYAITNDQGRHVGQRGKASDLGLYIWDTSQNTFSRYANLGPNIGRQFCFNNGFIVYSISRDSNFVEMAAGEFGHEKTLHKVAINDPLMLPYNDRCEGFPRLVQKKRPDILGYERGFQLRGNDGYIYVAAGPDSVMEVTSKNQNDPVKLYHEEAAAPLILPILAKEMDVKAKISYSDFAGKYIILAGSWKGSNYDGILRSWPKGVPITIYLLSPDGKVEATSLPPDSRHPASVFISRRGIVWVSNSTTGNQSATAGGWLLEDGTTIKLFNEPVSGAGISPDGCKFAFANMYSPYLKVINLCTRDVK